MYLVTSEEMRKIDRYTIDSVGIPSLVLMENAGRAIAEEAFRLAETGAARGRPPRWLILVGKGNNGGDGLVCARHMAERGWETLTVYAVPPEQLKGEAAVQRDIADKLGLPAVVFEPGKLEWGRFDGIVDALLGTGTAGEPREPYASLIREANASGLPIVAADIPSGLNADTGDTADACIRATVTVALAMLKRGLLLHPGAEAAGRTVVRPIGIPEGAARELGVNTFVLNEETLRRRFGLSAVPPARAANTHKGTYGHVLAVAGSRRMSGAGLLCAKAALRAGCGLVTWALPEALALPLAGVLPEAMIRGIADGGSGEWADADVGDALSAAADKQAVVIGPGLGRWAGDSGWLRRWWQTVASPLVVDADALNMLAAAGAGTSGSGPAAPSAEPFSAWPRRESATVLTPHPGEMARLCGLSVREVQRDRIGLARDFALRHGVVLVLKGARTVVASPSGEVYVNTTGNPGMATGGTGDVLAGVIAALLAQGMDATAAAALGVYMHGAAGDRAAAARTSPASLIAGDVVDWL
ncbi:MAG: bifunctional ADP-dependent NAD(P)H-hydrate dehydratase/NAD(P)H-hydrate epimerase [Cohnella sp.]|uniref:NAD(P)H-hydrate dehydratase n=1 Tax=Cohnella sp. TaxID=1883426 RepID=UPI000E3A7239|nr:NAD(P)H-hydrate dehydratase [Cohnella sp.]REK68302.1 MAG: bifunctional ADP-dependent NAD(P)H-hydrate dehydratase/NAD(P)H-hydrate epimerase [Cohnella sp.]